MSEALWYIEVTLPNGQVFWVYEFGPYTQAHVDFLYAEAFTADVAESTYRRVLAHVPLGTVVQLVSCDAEAFALPENLRRVINA